MAEMVTNMAKDANYVSFLLRLWQVDEGQRVLWRASLESAQTGEKQYFASVKALTDYLQQEYGQYEVQKENGDL